MTIVSDTMARQAATAQPAQLPTDEDRRLADEKKLADESTSLRLPGD
jgi:hypothetical protein